MLKLFATEVIDPEWGNYFVLTTWGYMALIVLLLCVLLAAAYASKSHKPNTKQLVFCAMAMALATVTSYLKIWHMPMGGSVTLFSMLRYSR